MLKSTNNKQGELLNTQLSVENNPKQNSGNTITERIPIDGTPFTRMKSEKGYAIVLGLYAITPTFKTIRQVNEYMKKNQWNLTVNVLHAMLDFHKLINTKQLAEEIKIE